MLRITSQAIDESTLHLKMDGKLLEPWIDELHRSLHGSSNCLHLDLSSLTFADSAGIRVLADLIRHGAKVTGCSGYIAARLQRENA